MMKSILQIMLVVTVALMGCTKQDSDKAPSTGDSDYESSDRGALVTDEPRSNSFWWPELINLQPLRQGSVEANPYGESFSYKKEFESLNLKNVKEDIRKILTTSQDWWPADYGHYGPFFIRMAWHSAGTYRVVDGRGGAGGGQQRFEPLNSWPDNANLDKARRLLWPVKKKYGKKLSWADLMVLTGNVSLEDMGFKTYGFAGGRQDDWEPEIVYWGPEPKMMAHTRRTKDGKLERPLGATQMGLIYVNPEGPEGKPDPQLAANAIREAFGRMAMDDEETVALIAGGHSFGKAHGAKKPSDCIGAEPAASGLEQQGMGWHNKCGTGKGKDATTSGLEGAWTSTPTQFSIQYLANLFNFEWEKTKSPAGAIQWKPKGDKANDLVPDAHDKNVRHAPMMFTTDIALKEDPEYQKISKRFLEKPEEFEKAFARAWFKLTHRDMGPRSRYLGSDVPQENLLWQDPIPKLNHKLVTSGDIDQLKKQILESGLSVSELVRTAWASASSFRNSDMRGGADGARLRLEPQKGWAVNNPEELSKTLATLTKIQTDFNEKASGGKKVSLADVILLGGAAAIEKAAAQGGNKVSVAFKPGRMDARQEDTDVKSFGELEPKADAFRNYYADTNKWSPTTMLVDKSQQLNLSVPEMTVLIGGMRVLGANFDDSKNGVFTDKVGTLSNDFFVNLLDMSTEWKKDESKKGFYIGVDRKTGETKWSATPVDLVFGSSAELRAVAEAYAADDGKKMFVDHFVKAWTKVMNSDQF
jgi:catalase-peroxidase